MFLYASIFFCLLFCFVIFLHALNASSKDVPKKAVSSTTFTCENSCSYHNHKNRTCKCLLEDKYNCFQDLLLKVAAYIAISVYVISLDFNKCWLPIELIGFFTSYADSICTRETFASFLFSNRVQFE